MNFLNKTKDQSFLKKTITSYVCEQKKYIFLEAGHGEIRGNLPNFVAAGRERSNKRRRPGAAALSTPTA